MRASRTALKQKPGASFDAPGKREVVLRDLRKICVVRSLINLKDLIHAEIIHALDVSIPLGHRSLAYEEGSVVLVDIGSEVAGVGIDRLGIIVGQSESNGNIVLTLVALDTHL